MAGSRKGKWVSAVRASGVGCCRVSLGVDWALRRFAGANRSARRVFIVGAVCWATGVWRRSGSPQPGPGVRRSGRTELRVVPRPRLDLKLDLGDGLILHLVRR